MPSASLVEGLKQRARLARELVETPCRPVEVPDQGNMLVAVDPVITSSRIVGGTRKGVAGPGSMEVAVPKVGKVKKNIDGSSSKHRGREKKRHRAEEKRVKRTRVSGPPCPSGPYDPFELRAPTVAGSPEEHIITVGINEHWASGEHFPIHVFDAFRLTQDSGHYRSTLPGEVCFRNLVRLGRFISDYLYISDNFQTLGELKSQNDVLRKALEEAQAGQRTLIEQIEVCARKEASWAIERASLSDKVEKAVAELSEKVKQVDDLESSHKFAIGELRTLLTAEKEELSSKIGVLGGKLLKFEDDLAQSRAESVDAFEEGFNKSVERFEKKGVDVVGNTFMDYCQELDEEAVVGQATLGVDVK